ncbi:sensor histidine kinase [Micromonosporaceae bacterium Da 78-11]
MSYRSAMVEHGTVIARQRVLLVLGLAAYASGLTALLLRGVTDQAVPAAVVLSPAIVLGILVAWRRPGSPVGPALVALTAAPCLTWAVEDLGSTSFVGSGVWVFNLTGFVLLCLVFPDGRLPGRHWQVLPWVGLAVAAAVVVVLGSEPDGYADRGGSIPGSTPLPLSATTYLVLDVLVGAALLLVLAGAAAAPLVRYRRGDALVREQLRWLILGAGSVPVLLGAGWAAELAGASTDVAYAGFIAALALFVPATVAIAILRHDLLDVDRLLDGTVSWLVTTVVSAGVFAAVVLVVASAVDDRVSITVAAFVTALALLPVHRRVHALVGQVLDRERTVLVAGLRDFVRRVRDGEAEPELVQETLRGALGDPGLQVLLRLPGSPAYVDLDGSAVVVEPAADALIPLNARDSAVGALLLSRPTARRRRQAREAAVETRLPIEVSRLRLSLRLALDDARASRSRLVEAVTEERRRLERDLHDGAQQGILAVGMRLRLLQRRGPAATGDGHLGRELDAAVAGLEDTIAELRRLAHGIRPSRLGDGLDAALRDLADGSPLPVEVSVATEGAAPGEAVTTTAYFVVAECLTNAAKHAGATGVTVCVTTEDDRLVVRVSDDGRGGAVARFGLTAMQDRVVALGGAVTIVSPAGGGTTVRAVL